MAFSAATRARTGGGRQTDDGRAAFAHDRLQVLEVDVDGARRVDDFRNAHACLVEHFVAHFKAFLHRGVRGAFALELLVENHDHRVDLVLEVLDALFRATHATAAFEAEGLRDDGNREDAHFLGDLGDGFLGGCGSRDLDLLADSDDVRVGDPVVRCELLVGRPVLGHLLALFLSCGRADFRPGTSAEARGAELDVHVRTRTRQGLMVRVRGDKFDALRTMRDHVLDGIATAAAHADHLDDGVQRIKFLQDLKRHFLPQNVEFFNYGGLLAFLLAGAASNSFGRRAQ